MKMTVGELRERLEGLEDGMEVRIAHQPNWPFQLTVADALEVATFDQDDYHDEETDEMVYAEAPAGCPVYFYIVEGSQVYDDPYLPGSVRDAIGWGR